MPNPRRNVKDEFWVVVLVAVIIVAALIIMWWKWIILGVLLVSLGFILVFILKAVLKEVPSKREPFAPSQRAQIERQDDSNKQVKTEYPKASEKQESYNAKTSPRVCAFVDCKTPVLPYDTLCSEHYQKRKDGLINQCPNCGTFKDPKYPLCSACYHQHKDTIQKTVFDNVASEREPLSPYERDDDTPESFIKGEKFENYIRNYLFPKGKFKMLHRTPSYAINKNDYSSEDSEKPDFKFRAKTGKEFFVEAKYRSRYYEDKVEWCKPFQLKRYKEIDEELPVYITLGVEGEAGSPDQVFLIPVKNIPSSYTKLFRSFLRNYAVPKDKPIDYKLLQ